MVIQLVDLEDRWDQAMAQLRVAALNRPMLRYQQVAYLVKSPVETIALSEHRQFVAALVAPAHPEDQEA